MSIENYQNHFRFRQFFALIGSDFFIFTPEIFPQLTNLLLHGRKCSLTLTPLLFTLEVFTGVDKLRHPT